VQLGLQQIQVLVAEGVVLGNDLVAGAVVADGVAERDVYILNSFSPKASVNWGAVG